MNDDLNFLKKKACLFDASAKDLRRLIDTAAQVVENPIAMGPANSTAWHVTAGMPEDAIVSSTGSISHWNHAEFQHFNEAAYDNTNPIVIPKLGGYFGSYEYLVSAIRVSGKVVAFTNATICRTALTEASIELFSIYCRLLCRKLACPETLALISGDDIRALELKAIIDGKRKETAILGKSVEFLGKRLIVLVVTHITPYRANAPTSSSLSRLRTALGDGICFYHENTLIALCPLEDVEQDRLERMLKEEGLVAGISYPFYRLQEIKMRWVQACDSLRLKKPGNHKCLHDFSGAVIPLLYELSCSPGHPFALKLNDYDRLNGTSLSLTLFTYLTCDKSINLTANALGIHRNTILQRLERISALLETPAQKLNWDVAIALSKTLPGGTGKTECRY